MCAQLNHFGVPWQKHVLKSPRITRCSLDLTTFEWRQERPSSTASAPVAESEGSEDPAAAASKVPAAPAARSFHSMAPLTGPGFDAVLLYGGVGLKNENFQGKHSLPRHLSSDMPSFQNRLTVQGSKVSIILAVFDEAPVRRSAAVWRCGPELRALPG